jgi:hypothetical protein
MKKGKKWLNIGKNKQAIILQTLHCFEMGLRKKMRENSKVQQRAETAPKSLKKLM